MDDLSHADRAAVTEGSFDQLGFLVYRAGLAIARGYQRALAPIDVAPTEAGVLIALARSGPNHTRGLARVLGIGRQTVTNVTGRLEEREWITRSLDAHDGRMVRFSIAAKGVRKLKKIEELSREFDGWLLEIVGSGKEAALIKQMTRIIESPLLAHED
jgi:DNA-binding MarR family transcriptional regulator